MNERQSGATTPDDFQEKLIEYIKQTAVKHAISEQTWYEKKERYQRKQVVSLKTLA
ncbi:MAG: hypothetical protein WBZ20_04490 [Nitrososphaeraceae archaeon]